MDSPVVNNFALQQTFKELFEYGNNMSAGILAPPTYAPDSRYPSNLTYVSGQLMARYTSGTYQGQYVGYDSTGTNGQNVCVGFLNDDYIPWTYPGAGKLRGRIQFGSRPYNMVLASQLVAKITGDIATGMTSLGWKFWPNFNGSGVDIWYIA